MKSNCIFCKIISGEIPSKKVYEDDRILCFHDLNPQAEIHVLIIPKLHVSTLLDLKPEHSEIMGYIMTKLPEISSLLNISAQDGFRLVVNCGEKAGQTVFHLHFHLLSGRAFGWPPG